MSPWESRMMLATWVVSEESTSSCRARTNSTPESIDTSGETTLAEKPNPILEPKHTTGVTGSDKVQPSQIKPTEMNTDNTDEGVNKHERVHTAETPMGTAANTSTSDYTERAKRNTSSTENTATENTSTTDTTSSSAPHKEMGSSMATKDMSHAQQDVRDPSDPQTDPKEANIKSNVDDSTGGTDVGNNPEKINGPGPKPIELVAKSHGGDAGQAKPAARATEGEDADEEEDGDGPQKKSHGSGTGEQWVKSSGLKADGGDFDATKPGAGREADRMLSTFPHTTRTVLREMLTLLCTGLLEEKGVHREGGDKPGATTDDAADDTKPKKSLGEKIKAKLHKPHMAH